MILSDLGLNLNNVGQYEEALLYLNQSIAITDEYYHPYYCKACIFSKTNQLEEAISMIKKVLELDSSQLEQLKNEPDFENIRNSDAFKQILKVEALKQEHYNELIEEGRKAIEINPNNYIILSNLGSNLTNLGQYEEALLYLNQSIAINDKYYHPYYCKACIFSKTNQLEEAISMIKKVLELDPSQLKQLKNELDFENIRNSDAFKQLFKDEALKAEHYNKLIMKGGTLVYHKKYKEAIEEVYKILIEIKPKNIAGWKGMGVCCSWLGDYEKAIFYNKKAIEIDPNNYLILSDLGSNLNKVGQYEEALLYLNQSIAITDKYYHPYYCKACIFSKTNQLEEAISMIKKALELDSSQLEQLKNEPDFENIRNSDAFKQILKVMEEKELTQEELIDDMEEKELTQEELMFLIGDFECLDEHFEIHLEKEGRSAEIQGDSETNEFYMSFDNEDGEEQEFEEELESPEALSNRLGEAVADLLDDGWKVERAQFLAAKVWTSDQWRLIDFNKLYDMDFRGTPDEQFERHKRDE